MVSAQVLVVSPDAPGPLDQGFRIRVHHLVAALVQGDHRVTLLAAPGGRDDGALADLGVEVLRCPQGSGSTRPAGFAGRVRDIAAGRPPGTQAAAVAGLLPVLGRLLVARRFDAVQVELPELVKVVASRGVRCVLDAHNIWSELTRRRQVLVPSTSRRLAGAVLAHRQRVAEQRSWRAADLCLATSERESAVMAAAGARRTALVPNGVDVDAIRPAGPPGCDAPPRLVFVGLLSYGPNADAATSLVRDVLPLVHQSRPDVRVRIVGAGAPPALAALAGPHVELTGGVADVRPHLAAAAAVVTPLRVGSGTRLKILEALAMARPVVSTGMGAEGLGLVDGVHALLADGPEALAAAVLRVLGHPDMAADLGRAGRALVESSYAWSHVGARLQTAYRELLEGG